VCETTTYPLRQNATMLHMSVYYRHVAAIVNTLGPPSKILEAGCGAGQLMAVLSKDGHDVYGYDISDRDKPHFSSDTLTDRIKIIKSNEPIPHEDDSFDFVVSNMVIEHVFDLETFASETMRVLRPGGYAVHTFPVKEVLFENHIKQPLTHWFPNNAWIGFWHKLGVGKHFELGSRYFTEKACYRLMSDIKRTFPGARFGYSGHVFLQRLRPTSEYRREVPMSSIVKWLAGVTMTVHKEAP